MTEQIPAHTTIGVQEMAQTAKKRVTRKVQWRGKRISKFFSETVEQRVWDLMEEGWTIQQIANRGNLHPSTLRYHMEHRTFLPRPSVFWGLAQALGLDEYEMFELAYYSTIG